MPFFPPELLDIIFSHLDADKKTLSACSLVSREGWLPFASLRLFRSLKFAAYVPERHGQTWWRVTFRDLLDFVQTCPRAREFTRSLTLDGSWRRRYVDCMEPPFVARLPVDMLFAIVSALSGLQCLTLRSVPLSVPSIMFEKPAQPVRLEVLVLDYALVHPFAQPDGRPGFDPITILPLFAPTKVEVCQGPFNDRPRGDAHIVELRIEGRARMAELALRMEQREDMMRALKKVVRCAEPNCLQSLRLALRAPWDNNVFTIVNALLSRSVSRELKTLGILWGNGVKMRIDADANVLPRLAFMPQLSTIIIVQTLNPKTRFRETRNTFAGTMSILRSAFSARAGCKARLILVAAEHTSVQDVPQILRPNWWHWLDRATEGCEVRKPGEHRIEIRIGHAGQELPAEIFARMRDVIHMNVSRRTQRLLKLSLIPSAMAPWDVDENSMFDMTSE